MLTDGYGLALSTTSGPARDAYVEGCGLVLTMWPGAVEAFDRALDADPGFALARAGKARALQMQGDPAGARAAMVGTEDAPCLSAREASHLAMHRHLVAGDGRAALAVIRAHLAAWPRDAMVLAPTANQVGLIGLSGQAGREQALAALLDGLAPAYGEDPWFAAHHAMALSEVGRRAEAEPLAERAIARQSRNGYAARAVAHLHYEAGERDAAARFLRGWLEACPRRAMLRGHLSWHLALEQLEDGDVATGLALYDDAFAPDEYPAPALVKLIDGASFLWRAELAGHPQDPARWHAMQGFARRAFPRPGLPMADWHVADAGAGDAAALTARVEEIEAMAREGRYPAGGTVPAVARGVAAFRRGDHAACIAALAPVRPELERIGGSHAQTDLVEFTLLRACVAAGRLDDARRLLAARRPGPGGMSVAGIERVVRH